MTTDERHTIGKQYLDVSFDGSEYGAITLQSAISALNRHGIAPAIGRILDRHAADGSVLRLDRLEVDAGAVLLDQLEARLPAMIAEALDKALAEIATPDAKINDEAIKEPSCRRLSEAEAAVDALLFFLLHGTLPVTWRPQSHESFEALLLEAWSHGGLVRQTAKTLASATARQRLLAQYSRQVTATLIEALLPGAMPVIGNLLDRFRSSGLPEEPAGRIERELLDEALALSAKRTNITPEELQATLLTTAMSRREISDELQRSKTETEALARAKQRPTATESSDDETARQTLNSAPRAQRDGEQAPLSIPEADAQNQKAGQSERKAPKRASLDENSTPSGHHRSDRSDGVTETSPDAVADAIAKSPTTPDSSSGSSDTGALDREADDVAREQTNEPLDHEASAKQPKPGSTTTEPDSGSGPVAAKKRNSGKPASQVQETDAEHPDERRGLYVQNAGLVLLHPFLPQLFGAMKIAGDDELLRPGDALRLLHYLATGLDDAPEYELALPKILCGLPPASLAEEAEPLSDEMRKESAALLEAVIRHWEALKNTGTDALRESFLKRNGKLTRWHDGGWLLQVESNSFDILLDRLPWSFSMIRLPWMPSMLHVEWRF